MNAGILEQQHGAAATALELQGAHGPRAVQLLLQRIFVRQPIKARGCSMLGGKHSQHGVVAAIGILTRGPAKDAVVVLPYNP